MISKLFVSVALIGLVSGCANRQLIGRDIKSTIAESKMLAFGIKSTVEDIARLTKDLQAAGKITEETANTVKAVYEKAQKAQNVFLDSVKALETLHATGVKKLSFKEVFDNKAALLLVLTELQELYQSIAK